MFLRPVGEKECSGPTTPDREHEVKEEQEESSKSEGSARWARPCYERIEPFLDRPSGIVGALVVAGEPPVMTLSPDPWRYNTIEISHAPIDKAASTGSPHAKAFCSPQPKQSRASVHFQPSSFTSSAMASSFGARAFPARRYPAQSRRLRAQTGHAGRLRLLPRKPQDRRSARAGHRSAHRIQ
jgi:hypothetical protein